MKLIIWFDLLSVSFECNEEYFINQIVVALCTGLVCLFDMIIFVIIITVRVVWLYDDLHLLMPFYYEMVLRTCFTKFQNQQDLESNLYNNCIRKRNIEYKEDVL